MGEPTKDELLSAEQLAEIQQRCEAATEGPWTTEADGVINKIITPNCDFRTFDHHMPCNAEFIAHARTDIPALLAHAAALQAQLEGQRRLTEQAENLAEKLQAQLDALTEAMRQGAILYEPVIQQRVESFRRQAVEAVRAKQNSPEWRNLQGECDPDNLEVSNEVITLLETLQLPATTEGVK